MEQELLTIAELARHLDLPESTTRYYCNRFADHLPSIGEGRRRRFKPEALDVLQTIAQTMRRDKNAYAVDLALRGNASVPVPVSATVAPLDQAVAPTGALATQMLSLMESQTKALQEIAGAMSIMAEKFATPPPSAEHVSPSPETEPPRPSDDTLWQELAALRTQIRASESVHQNDLEQLRKWLTRLGEALAEK